MPPPLDVPENDVSAIDPARAAEMESAIRAAVPADEAIQCSLLLVGFPRELLRVEVRGADWCENLPLLPMDVKPATVGALVGGVVERRLHPRKPGH